MRINTVLSVIGLVLGTEGVSWHRGCFWPSISRLPATRPETARVIILQ